MLLIKLFFGVVFLILGWVYLFNTNLVININRIVKEYLFNDRQILLARKKIAILYLFIALILIYTSIASLYQTADKTSQKISKNPPVQGTAK
jgi:hypothetical protein